MTCILPDKCWCKSCKKEYHARNFQAKKQEILRQRAGRRNDIKEWVRSLKDNPCKDCGQKYHFAAMQFDHLSNKKYDVSTMVKHGHSRETIQLEIDKCELVCSNCHAIRTYNRQQHFGV